MEIIRRALLEVLTETEVDKPILLPYSEEEIRGIFFDKINGTIVIKEHLELAGELLPILEKIDFSNVPFAGVKVSSLDFSKLHGVRINPQEVFDKSLEKTNLIGVEFIKNNSNSDDLFENVCVFGARFGNNINAKINPQTVQGKQLNFAVLNGLDFTGCSFDGVCVYNTNFTGSTGVKINPQTLKDKCLTGAILAGVDFTDQSFDDAKINHADFTDSKGARINPNRIHNVEDRYSSTKAYKYSTTGLYNTNCCDAVLIDQPNKRVITADAKWYESNNAMLEQEQAKYKEQIRQLIKQAKKQ